MARLAEFQKLYGSPYMQVNRGHLHEALLKRARDVGVIMCENSKIVDYDLIQPSISLANGQVIMPDLVIAADGEIFLYQTLLSLLTSFIGRLKIHGTSQDASER